MSKLNTNIELVGYGHPDRFADYIGELILERHYEQDLNAKVAIEVLATRDSISLGGEVSSQAKINYEELVYQAIDFVYGEKWWPNFRETVSVLNHIAEQSPALSIIQGDKIVAGDQGVIYGYYNKHRFEIIKSLYSLMKLVKEEFDIAPDWKLIYSEENKNFSMSVCGDVNHREIEAYIKKVITQYESIEFNELIVNPKGEWLIPGPLSDTGVVGRKLMIDTFGAGVPHGGGAFCGKDVSKVDKTAILWASEIAREKFDSSIDKPDEVIVEMSFKIGDEKPLVNIVEITNQSINKSELDIQETLCEYIDRKNLKTIKWSKHVTNGGSVLSILNEI